MKALPHRDALDSERPQKHHVGRKETGLGPVPPALAPTWDEELLIM